MRLTSAFACLLAWLAFGVPALALTERGREPIGEPVAVSEEGRGEPMAAEPNRDARAQSPKIAPRSVNARTDTLTGVRGGSAGMPATGAPESRRQPGLVVRTQTPRTTAIRAIRQVFGARAPAAIRVAHCETGGTFNPRALGSAGERGLFQIHPVHFRWASKTRLFEPVYNSRIAYRLSRGGTNWRPWTCRP